MTIDRTELERLLADRPTGNRSAMQAVRDSYDDIGLMRERGLSWAEISDVLAKLGVTTRDAQPISPVTLRSAFFLVGAELRNGDAAAPEDEADEATLGAVHRAALESGRPGAAIDRGGAGGEDADADADAAVPAGPASAGDRASDAEVEAAGAAAADGGGASSPEPAADAPPTPVVAPAPGPEPEPQPGPEPASEAPPVPRRDHDTGGGVGPAAPAPPRPSVSPAPRPTPPDTTNDLWKGDFMLGTIFVLNDRGGVGKTLLSHHLMATAMLEGLQLRVVEYEVNERLARLFGPEVVEHRRISQDFMNLMGSGDGFYEFWDQIGPELQRGGRLYDFGGNISQWFFNWAEVSGIDYYVGDGERLTFMVPVTVDLASLSTGMATLDRIAAIAPRAKRVLVENGVSGPFSQLEDSQYGRRKAELMEREGVQVLSMPPCTAPAWARLTGHRLDQVAQMTREDLAKLGMSPPVASRSLIIIHEWLRTMRQALAPYLVDAFRQTPPVSGKSPASAR
ncbi:hypothetical protein [Azospirillum sp. A39]|uniref:hypothetical protein n=1 Tax=Azospirillum sp. A39 TaxID=3462279 RepID=UPI0040454160